MIVRANVYRDETGVFVELYRYLWPGRKLAIFFAIPGDCPRDLTAQLAEQHYERCFWELTHYQGPPPREAVC